MRTIRPHFVETQAEALRGYLETGGDLRLWLSSKGFNGPEKVAILRRFRELDGKPHSEPVNLELAL